MGSLLSGFFCFLRAGEFTVPDHISYDPSCHLSYGNMAVYSRERPEVVRIMIKQSKTDTFLKGINLYIGRMGLMPCSSTVRIFGRQRLQERPANEVDMKDTQDSWAQMTQL